MVSAGNKAFVTSVNHPGNTIYHHQGQKEGPSRWSINVVLYSTNKAISARKVRMISVSGKL